MYIPSTSHKPSGKTYRYYILEKNQKMGAGTVKKSNLPADKLEQAVLGEVLKALRTGQMVHRYWDQITRMNAQLTEPQAMVALFSNTASVWDKLAPKAKCDITRTLIQRVTVLEDGLDIQWRFEAWGALVGDIPRKTAGHELQDMEAA